MAELLRKRKLNTHVMDECSSACTLAFLAGEVRTISRKGALGFHASRLVGLPVQAVTGDGSPREAMTFALWEPGAAELAVYAGRYAGEDVLFDLEVAVAGDSLVAHAAASDRQCVAAATS